MSSLGAIKRSERKRKWIVNEDVKDNDMVAGGAHNIFSSDNESGQVPTPQHKADNVKSQPRVQKSVYSTTITSCTSMRNFLFPNLLCRQHIECVHDAHSVALLTLAVLQGYYYGINHACRG